MAFSLRSLFFLYLVCILTSCQGTETGNPSSLPSGEPVDSSQEGAEATYESSAGPVEAEYDSAWSVEEKPAAGGPAKSTGGEVPASPPCANCFFADAFAEGIDTSESPFTEFTDGTSKATLFFVTLDQEPASLESYLQDFFPGRGFRSFSNRHIPGFSYDNPESGETGGDRQEYYFLKDELLLYLITDLYDANDGRASFEILIDSLRFL